jgi:hypothetical protein
MAERFVRGLVRWVYCSLLSSRLVIVRGGNTDMFRATRMGFENHDIGEFTGIN